MINYEMLNALDWQKEDVDCEWNTFSAQGFAYGYAYTYGRNNNPYNAIKRESDGMIAYIPTNKGCSFSTSSWDTKSLMEEPHSI